MPSPVNLLRPLVATLLLVASAATAADDSRIEMLDRLDKLEKLDRMDFVDTEGKARVCIAERNFSCARTQLEKARRYATVPRSRKELEQAWQALEAEIALQKKEEGERLAAIQRQQEIEAELRREAREAREEAAREERNERALQGAIAYMKGDYSSAAALGVPGADVLSMQQKAYARDREMVAEIKAAQQQNADRRQQERARAVEEARRTAQLRQQQQAALASSQRPVPATPPRTVNPVTPPTVTINYPAMNCPPGSSWQSPQSGIGAPGGTCYENPGSAGYQGGGYGASTASAAGKGSGDSAMPQGSGGAAPRSSSTAPAATSASGDAGAVASRDRPSFRMRPASVPAGSTAGGLRNASGDYRCDAVNAYARQHAGSIKRRFNDYISASYKTEAKCQARCDVLMWREELVRTFDYRGQWSCSVAAVEAWNAANLLSGYDDGDNDDRCTCIGSNGAPLDFTP